MKSVLRLRGLDCAHCAAELEEKISTLDGVQSAVVSFVNGLLTVEYDGEETLERIIAETNAFEEVRVVEESENADAGKKRRVQWLLIALSALFFVGGVLLERFAVGAVAHYICYALAYFAVGYPVLVNTGKNIVKGKIFDENFLMTVASIGAALLGEWSESVLVMLLYQIGETLQGMAVDSSRRSITRLMDLKSEWATVLDECDCGACHEHAQKQVRPEALKIGDTVLVKAGEKVPVDGVLLDETASLDTKSLTGESELRQVKAGEELLSGCINAGNAFKMRVVREYENSAVSKILDLVENASSGKAKPEKFITKFARYYTPIVCVAALLLAFAVPFIYGLVSGGDIPFKDFPRWSKSALTFLVVSCPCALIISVPLTYFSGIGACAKKGILVKGATYLDEVAHAKIFAFDKTGTLTEGNFTVCEVREQGVSKEELLYLAAAVERASSHPIAKAFENVPTPYVAQEVREFSGRGLSGVIDGKTVLIGSVRLLRENKVFAIEERSPYTLIYIAREDTYLGCIAVGDKLREETKEALSQLRNAGAERLVILTGDTPERAQKIAYEAGVSEVKASLLPDEKLREANEYKKEGGFVYVGDGVNDAPVMAVADCGVSMGKLGSAAAVEASDLVLVSDNLSALPKCVKIAKKTRSVALQNIVFSIVMKVAFMTLGALGVLPLGLAVFADVGVMLLAVLNALRVS